MKIIDKYQDFYDFDAYMYGCEPDQSIVWNRDQRRLQLKDIKDVFERKKVEDFIYKNLWAPISNGTSTKYGQHSYFCFKQWIIGIYPYIYYCPLICRVEYVQYNPKTKENAYTHTDVIPISKDAIQYPAKIFKLIEPYYQKKDVLPYYIEHNMQNEKKYNMSYYGTKRDIEKNWITENREIFSILDTPTFVVLCDPRSYNYNTSTEIYLDANISGTDFFKCYSREDIDPNIYSNIEQFLSLRNTKPISEPDNKTKIINAGFDTKTSFRKM